MSDTITVPEGYKPAYRGCDVPHGCEAGYCHICEAHFATWHNDPRPEWPPHPSGQDGYR